MAENAPDWISWKLKMKNDLLNSYV